MAREILLMDGFERDGGTGRFGPGRLTELASYEFGGLVGVYAINLGIAVYWGGGAVDLMQFYTPSFQTRPTGGCNPGTGAGCGGAVQLSLGTLSATVHGGLSFAGSQYYENYSGTPFTTNSDAAGPRLMAGAWNWVEFKLAVSGAYFKGTGQPCQLDPDPDPYGLITARINGTECLRKAASVGPYTYAVFVPCGCFLCTYFPVGIGKILVYGDPYGDTQTHPDDFMLASYDMRDGEDAWLGDVQTSLIAAGGAGSSAQWVPVGAATNAAAAATNDGATSYNRTNLTGKRDALALIASADTTAVFAAQPQIVVRSIYKAGGGPPVKAFYRRGGMDYATGTLSPATTFSLLSEDAGVPTVGETLATLSAGEIGYTTE